MDRGSWRVTVHGVAKSWIQPHNWECTCLFITIWRDRVTILHLCLTIVVLLGCALVQSYFRENPPVLTHQVQFSRSVVSNSLWPHEQQHPRPPYLSPTPGVHPNPCPLSRWCHPTMSFSIIPFSSCPQSFPASGSFQLSHLFASGGQSIGVSASTSVLPMNTQDWSPLGWTGWISLQSKGLSRGLSRDCNSSKGPW